MFRKAIATALIVASAAACSSGAGASPSAPTAAPAPRAHAPYSAADVAFMQGMIAHHGQALDMTALAETRAGNASLRILAQRIEATQENEILRMSQWLAARGETVPDPASYRGNAGRGHAGHGAHGALMPGMLTAAEMERLAAASGAAFDRLFLEHMISHHEGALTMVADLHQAGGGLEPEIYLFASDVDADQRAEIARMRSLLTEIQRGS